MATIVSNYNVKQITNYDIVDKPSIKYTIPMPSRKEIDNKIFIETIPEEVEYKTALDGIKILKLGYCCEPKGHIYPIYLQINGAYKQFQIGRDGMYEMQPETWKDANNSEAEETTTDVIITGVRVPVNINFTLDYVVSIN